MELNFLFFFNSLLLGVGLAMDAFSVSLANGLNEPHMNGGKMTAVAGVFGIFQGIMPLIGWVCIHTVVQFFTTFEKLIPWIALALLGYIGGKMLYEGITNRCGEEENEGKTSAAGLTFGALVVQGIATSIDALSVGFTIPDYDPVQALLCAAIIAAVTFPICIGGILIGRKVGTCLAGKAGILGGVILIAIGLWIFISSWL